MFCTSWNKDEIWENMNHDLPGGEVPALIYMFSQNFFRAVAQTVTRDIRLAFLETGQRPQTLIIIPLLFAGP